jgi:hypothetical protein
MRCARLHTIAVIVFLSGAAASAQTPESPHDLWEHMIAAKGGHERLQSVRTFAWMATRVTPAHRNWSEGPSMVYVAAPPDHLWIYESGYAETWRGRGLSSPRMGIPATLTSLEAWQLACFLETSVVRPTPVSVEPSAEDARVVILEATSEHLKVRYSVDRESYIVRQVTLSRRTDDPESGFSRFIDERPFTLEGTETVGGIQMPRWIRTGDYVRDLRFLINPELDEGLFEPWTGRPARLDAWGDFLLADHQAAKRLADLRPGLPPPSRKPAFLVGGGYDGTLRESGRAAAIFAADDWLRNVTRLPAVYAEATGGPGGVRVTAGAMALQPVFSLLQVVGASVGATVTWTSGAPRETSPHSTYVGGQAGILLFFVKVDLGVDVRVRGGEPNAPHAAGFRWSVGYQVPIAW